jgi:hypothetical protein
VVDVLTYAPVPDIGLADVEAICRANVVAALATAQEAGRPMVTSTASRNVRQPAVACAGTMYVRCGGAAPGTPHSPWVS